MRAVGEPVHAERRGRWLVVMVGGWRCWRGRLRRRARWTSRSQARRSRCTPMTPGRCRSPSRVPRPASSSPDARAGQRWRERRRRCYYRDTFHADRLRPPRQRLVQDQQVDRPPGPTGDGSAGNPYTLTIDLAVASVFHLQESSRTSTGARTSESGSGSTTPTAHRCRVRLFEAADLYVAGDDSGVGFLDPGPPLQVGGINQPPEARHAWSRARRHGPLPGGRSTTASTP